jgi:isatin hydrolase
MTAELRGQDNVGALLAGIIASHRVVDLSLTLAEDMPCTWPGHMPFRATVWSWFASRPSDPQPVHPRTGGSYQTRWLVLDEHVGTHADAPRHFIPPAGSGLPYADPAGEVGIDRLPLLAAAGPADVVDVTSLGPVPAGRSPVIGVSHLAEWEAEHGQIAPGDVVLLRSDWDVHYQSGPAGSAYGSDVLVAGTRPGWPAPAAEAVEWLHGRGVRCLGTDGFSVGAAEGGAPAHLAGLSRGMTFVEALGGLRALPPRGAWFLFLPLRLADGTGGPGRALAVLPATESAATPGSGADHGR